LNPDGSEQVSKEVAPSGTRHVTDSIGGDVGHVRLRYPIFPIHDQSSLTYRELSAQMRRKQDRIEDLERSVDSMQAVLGKLIDALNNLQFKEVATEFNDVGKFNGDLQDVWRHYYGDHRTLRLQLEGGSHSHEIECGFLCFRTLVENGSYEKQSEKWDDHTHDVKISWNGSTIELEQCDNYDVCQDGHEAVTLPYSEGEKSVFDAFLELP